VYKRELCDYDLASSMLCSLHPLFMYLGYVPKKMT